MALWFVPECDDKQAMVGLASASVARVDSRHPVDEVKAWVVGVSSALRSVLAVVTYDDPRHWIVLGGLAAIEDFERAEQGLPPLHTRWEQRFGYTPTLEILRLLRRDPQCVWRPIEIADKLWISPSGMCKRA